MNRPRRSRRPRGRGPSDRPKKTADPSLELHPVAEPPDIASFREWDLAPEVQEVIAGMGIVEPTPIQRLAIQPVLDGRDVIAKAETGTGKTLAFGAPMMSRIAPERATILGLVLCPTRELAQQVHQVLTELGAPRDVKVALVVGGDPMHPQVDALRDGAQVVVGTPGRVLDLMGQRFITFPWTEFAVLDEADEMLEIGFLDDVRKILAACPDERQTLLFSATFPAELLRLAREHTKDPVEVATARGVVSVEGISHAYVKVQESDRADALKRLIASTGDDDVLLVFCDRRVEVERLMRTLERTRWSVKALHGGYDQAARFRVMSAFRDRDVKVLVATDVASRGLDVAHVTHVVNFSVPRDITDYTHRSGRTGRAGRKGHAVTLVAPSESRRWSDVRRRMTWDVDEIDETGHLIGDAAANGSEPADERPEPARRGERDAAPAERGRRRRRSEPRAAGSDEDRPRGDRKPSDDGPSGGRGRRRRSVNGRRGEEERGGRTRGGRSRRGSADEAPRGAGARDEQGPERREDRSGQRKSAPERGGKAGGKAGGERDDAGGGFGAGI